ncbi:MAG: flavoprotein [Acetobacteraceae bacterium]
MTEIVAPRWAWALTGSGHYLPECLDLILRLDHVDLFVSRAAAEVVRMYHSDFKMRAGSRTFLDKAASAPPVAFFYHGHYHTLVLAPATSNTVAKCVAGISDTLATNVFAQAGKCRVPSIVFACDTEPEMDTLAPEGMVKVYPRRIDLLNTQRLAEFEATTVALSLDQLKAALAARLLEHASDG